MPAGKRARCASSTLTLVNLRTMTVVYQDEIPRVSLGFCNMSIMSMARRKVVLIRLAGKQATTM